MKMRLLITIYSIYNYTLYIYLFCIFLTLLFSYSRISHNMNVLQLSWISTIHLHWVKLLILTWYDIVIVIARIDTSWNCNRYDKVNFVQSNASHMSHFRLPPQEQPKMWINTITFGQQKFTTDFTVTNTVNC